MFLSGSINLFDGEELLAPLLLTLRPELNHISVVYQTVSYWGRSASEELVPFLRALKSEELIDDLLHYDPREYSGTPKEHEARKRSLGLWLARAAGATHFISLDVDEFYRADEMRLAKRFIMERDFDVTVCRVQDYHSRSIFRCAGLADYSGADLYVPFICRVTDGREFDTRQHFFCCVDNSRRLAYEYAHAFPSGEIVMHHMTTIRRNHKSLVSKFVNSASRPVFPLENPEALADLVWRFDPRTHAAPRVSIVHDEFGLESVRQEAPSG